MKEWSNIKNVYMLGIGGIGMSALARWFKNMGFNVAGYDALQTRLTQELEKEGIDIHYQNKIGRIPSMAYQKNETLIIFTPAISDDNVEFQYFKNENYKIIKRSVALGIITQSQKSFCVAGTHGKTTTSTLLAHLLKYQGVKCSAFLGGISLNYNTNLIIGIPDAPVVIEADEYDRSFLQLNPYSSILTSVDPDHLDCYNTENALLDAFKQYLSLNQSISIIHEDVLNKLNIEKSNKVLTYGFQNSDYQCINIQLKNKKYQFDLVKNNELVIQGIKLGVPGRYNVLNATAAAALCMENGYSDLELLKKGIESFKGVERRFQVRWEDKNFTLIDDYAHHPKELEALLTTARELYENKKITIVFQPHLFSRTRDLKQEFGKSLSLADEVILLDIYPAREKPLDGITSASIAEYVVKPCKLVSKSYLLDTFNKSDFEVLIFAGAGDIDKLVNEMVKIL